MTRRRWTPGWSVRAPRCVVMSCVVVSSLFAGLVPTTLTAQRSAPVGITRTPADTVMLRTSTDSARPKPPLTPRRAFLTSLFLPGYAQSKLDRPVSAILYASFEVFAIGMARKAAQDLNEAKRASKDSVFVGSAIDPVTGQTLTNTYVQSPFTPDRIKARQTHYEDWIAALIFNHLLSSADAYVAANLWDFRTNVSVDGESRSAKIGARKSF